MILMFTSLYGRTAVRPLLPYSPTQENVANIYHPWYNTYHLTPGKQVYKSTFSDRYL